MAKFQGNHKFQQYQHGIILSFRSLKWFVISLLQTKQKIHAITVCAVDGMMKLHTDLEIRNFPALPMCQPDICTLTHPNKHNQANICIAWPSLISAPTCKTLTLPQCAVISLQQNVFFKFLHNGTRHLLWKCGFELMSERSQFWCCIYKCRPHFNKYSLSKY